MFSLLSKCDWGKENSSSSITEVKSRVERGGGLELYTLGVVTMVDCFSLPSLPPYYQHLFNAAITIEW